MWWADCGSGGSDKGRGWGHRLLGSLTALNNAHLKLVVGRVTKAFSHTGTPAVWQ